MKDTIGLFYGSNTGNTEEIVHKILDTLGADLVDTHDVGDGISASDFEEYKYQFISKIYSWRKFSSNVEYGHTRGFFMFIIYQFQKLFSMDDKLL